MPMARRRLSLVAFVGQPHSVRLIRCLANEEDTQVRLDGPGLLVSTWRES